LNRDAATLQDRGANSSPGVHRSITRLRSAVRCCDTNT
jgi:hypothetical protein